MGLISGLTKAIKSAASAVSSAVKSGSSSSGSGGSSGSSGSKSSSGSNSSSGSKSSGYYDPNKDYAAAIAKATSTSEKNQLIAERQNKIDAMNASGTNTSGYSNSVYTGGSSSSGGSGSTITPERAQTILNMYSNVSYDPNVDYAAAIKKAAERFGSEPYNVVQGEIDRLENQRYAKMIATGQINASNLGNFQSVDYGKVNYGQYTPDYYEKILNDNAYAQGAVGASNLSAGYGDLSGYFPTYQDPGYNYNNQFDYQSMLNNYNNQFQNMLNSFQKQQESTLNSLKQTQNYNTKVSDELSSSGRNIYGYDNNSYKGGQGASIKKSNAVSKYLADTAFKEGKFNQGV